MADRINWTVTTWADAERQAGIGQGDQYTWFWEPSFDWGKALKWFYNPGGRPPWEQPGWTPDIDDKFGTTFDHLADLASGGSSGLAKAPTDWAATAAMVGAGLALAYVVVKKAD